MLAFVVACCSPAENPPTLTSAYLTAAREAGSWLLSRALAEGSLVRIPDEVSGAATFSAGLGVGAAGRTLFFLELFYATQEQQWLDAAYDEARAAVAGVEAADPADLQMGLYGGVAGIGFALTEVYRASGDERWRDYAMGMFDRLATAAQRDDEGVRWNPVNDVLVGTAGIGLALLYAHEQLQYPGALELAVDAGNALIRRAEPVGDDLRWLRSEDVPLDLPNFSHGTAGVGYFLAALFPHTGDSRFGRAAGRAAGYVASIADREEGLFLVPYGVPNDGYSTAYDIGWAHGPAGTARLFYLLWVITESPEHGLAVRANALTIAASGMPEATSDPERWTGPFPIDRRFGTSGAATFLLKLHAVAPGPEYTALSDRVMSAILEESRESRAGRFWALPLYGFQGESDEIGIYTGYFYGAAGLGMALLEAHYEQTGRRSRIRLPDDPFPPGR